MTLNARRLCFAGLIAVLVLAAASLLLWPKHSEANSPLPQCTLGDRSEVWYFSTPARTTLVGKFSVLCAGGTRMSGTTSNYPTYLSCVCSPV
jgi:hypothetical protein